MSPPIDAEILATAVARHAPCQGLHATAIPPLDIYRQDAPSDWTPALYEPALFFLARGRKEMRMAGKVCQYDPAHYLMSQIDVPLLCRVYDTSPERPYLALRLRIEPLVVADLLASGARAPEVGAPTRGVAFSPIEPPMFDALLRLVRLLDAPEDAEILGPPTVREVLYRALIGPHGGRLRQMVASGTPTHQITQAIDWIRRHANDAISMEEAARVAGMGQSAFHLHFKTVTGMSPLQYQKRLRLMESKRLMLSSGLTAAEAAAEVGYASASQFSRDYRRLFGAPPRQDVAASQSLDYVETV